MPNPEVVGSTGAVYQNEKIEDENLGEADEIQVSSDEPSTIIFTQGE